MKKINYLFTNNMIHDRDVNKTLFPKFCFTGNKFVYQRMQNISEFKVKNNYDKLKLMFLSPFGALGIVFLTLIIIAGIVVPFTTQNPYQINPNSAFLDFNKNGHILGADNLGRDIWARTWWGLRNSIMIGTSAVIADLFLGVILGLLMGYYRSFDRIFGFVIKVLNTIPSTIILILLAIVLTPNVITIILGIVITGWIPMTLQVRSYVLSLNTLDYVTSSKLLDTPNRFIIKDFIPHILPIVFSMLILTIPSAVLADTSLSFFGILVPNLPTLGSVINAALGVIAVFPSQIIGPIFIVVFLVFNIQMISIAITQVFRSNR